MSISIRTPYLVSACTYCIMSTHESWVWFINIPQTGGLSVQVRLSWHLMEEGPTIVYPFLQANHNCSPIFFPPTTWPLRIEVIGGQIAATRMSYETVKSSNHYQHVHIIEAICGPCKKWCHQLKESYRYDLTQGTSLSSVPYECSTWAIKCSYHNLR